MPINISFICDHCQLNCGSSHWLLQIHRQMCPKMFTPEQLRQVKVRAENVPGVATCHWRGDEDGAGRQRGRPRALARATSSTKSCRQSDIRSFDVKTISRDSGGGGGARRVNINYCKLCRQSCGSELRLFRIHEMTCPEQYENASILESIKIHVSSPFDKVNHIWRGDGTYRKMAKRIKRTRSDEAEQVTNQPVQKRPKKRQSLITAFFQ